LEPASAPAKTKSVFLLTLPETLPLSENLHVQAAALDDAFQRANRDRFAAVHGHDYLSPVCVPPFLVAARLTDAEKTVQA
jgi:hypothetical protein